MISANSIRRLGILTLGALCGALLLGCAGKGAEGSAKSAATGEVVHAVKVPRGYRVAQRQSGQASWYGGRWHGRKTASGERFDQHALTAAHRKAPFGTLVLVTRPATGDQTLVRITDRGPFVRGRIIDLSRAAAEEIGMVGDGVAAVDIEILEKE